MIRPVPTFPKGSSAASVHARNRRRLEKLSGQSQTSDGKVSWIQDPVDPRGVPIIGRGVTGAIRHSRPGDGLR